MADPSNTIGKASMHEIYIVNNNIGFAFNFFRLAVDYV